MIALVRATPNALMAETRDRLGDIETPLLVMQSRGDPVVVGEYARTIMDKVATADKEMRWIDTDTHHILRENAFNTWDILDEYLISKQ